MDERKLKGQIYLKKKEKEKKSNFFQNYIRNPLETWWAWIAQEAQGTIKKGKLECKILVIVVFHTEGYHLSLALLLIKSWQE